MPKVSKESATGGGDYGPVVDRNNDVDGYRIGFTEFRQDVDATPLMDGLPDGMCQCPHWGYVLRGELTFRYADREEIYEAGDAYYAPPGHIPVVTADTEVVEFSPTEEYSRTLAVIARNFAVVQGG